MTVTPIKLNYSAAVIFDMDGTLALIGQRRHHIESRPKNWKAFYSGMASDEPNIPIINTLYGLVQIGYKAFICSGRPEKYRATTEEWLGRNLVRYHHLYMRPVDDFRTDVDVKLEMLAAIRNDGYNPVLACDDRDRLVKMWREQGLVCLQAAPGDF